ncbi:hypothetical protein TEQG_05937 [Trichophyton equinum CBS 127.97]|uniref:Uncharacterized protein n=1 Tax=Trichophyton equinum (strain ATCC MYA-4606 / CBS 127.97) TaxID=559882 RepID=F2PYB5_TRIEC|nr:hypothetical protein TEQG_05937 [Trichophyton equinum CBS 127.97]
MTTSQFQISAVTCGLYWRRFTLLATEASSHLSRAIPGVAPVLPSSLRLAVSSSSSWAAAGPHLCPKGTKPLWAERAGLGPWVSAWPRRHFPFGRVPAFARAATRASPEEEALLLPPKTSNLLDCRPTFQPPLALLGDAWWCWTTSRYAAACSCLLGYRANSPAAACCCLLRCRRA